MVFFTRTTRPSFRALTTADALACSALHGSAFAHGWSEMDFERLLASDTSHADGAFEGKTATGFILSRVAADEAEVLTIVVGSRWRQRGLGLSLLKRHLERLAAARVRDLFLEVNADNAAARALYAGQRFMEVGSRKGYYAKGGGAAAADALILRRSLV